MTIELTPEQVELLKRLLDQEIKQLGPEIHHTHSRAYRASLQEFRDNLETLHELLAHAA